MGAPGNNQFERLGGEFAEPQDIAVMEALARDLLKTVPYEEATMYQRESDNGLFITFGTVAYEHDEPFGSQALLRLGVGDPDDSSFELIFSHKNGILHAGYSEEDEVQNASVLLEDALATMPLEPAERAVLQHAQGLLYCIITGITPDKSPEAGVSVESGVHVADAIRTQVASTTSKSVRHRELRYQFDLRYDLMASTHEVMHTPTHELPEDIALFQLELDDHFTDKVYVFARQADNEIGWYVGSLTEGEEPPETLLDDSDVALQEALDELREDFGVDRPRKAHLELITKYLMEATVQEYAAELPELEQGWAYPSLIFEFDFPEQALAREPSNTQLEQLVTGAMEALADAERYVLPEICPGGFPTQPNYVPNWRKRSRVINYLHQKVAVGPKSRFANARRYEVVNIHKAAEQVLDQLASQQHPVSQMVSQLYDQYTEQLGDKVVQEVATEVVMLTHWKQVRRALVGQVVSQQFRQVHQQQAPANNRTT